MDPVMAALSELITITNDIFTNIGTGYNEVIYHRAFEVALRLKNISYQSEVVTPVIYKGHNIGHGRVDLIINGNIIVELKAISNFNNDTGVVQIRNYMKHYSINNGIIINFAQNNNKNMEYSPNIKYVTSDKVFNFINNSFIEIKNNVINMVQ